MKFRVNIRHRPQVSESVEVAFARFVGEASLLPPPWGLTSPSRLPPLGPELCQILQLRGKLGKGVTGRILFRIRAEDYLKDRSSLDDYLIIEFDAGKVKWDEFVDNAFPTYARAVGAYYGSMARVDEPISYWRRAVEIGKATGRDLDGRDGFFRFGPINFMDRELCRRGCGGMTPQQIVDQLTGVVPDVRLFEDGVIIVAADHFPEEEEIAASDRAIRRHLGFPVWAEQP